jgi:solute carrier family 45 protein 1/2/4
MQCWAPFTFLGIELNRLNSDSNSQPSGTMQKDRDSLDISTSEKEKLLSFDSEKGPESTSGSNLSGAYLGILNLYTTLPQFIGTFISWAVFSILEPGKSPELAKHVHPDEHHSTDGPNAIAVCLFIGAIAAMVAARATLGLASKSIA